MISPRRPSPPRPLYEVIVDTGDAPITVLLLHIRQTGGCHAFAAQDVSSIRAARHATGCVAFRPTPMLSLQVLAKKKNFLHGYVAFCRYAFLSMAMADPMPPALRFFRCVFFSRGFAADKMIHLRSFRRSSCQPDTRRLYVRQARFAYFPTIRGR